MDSSNRERALICGGTNFLGPHLVGKLLEKGYDVAVCTRGIHEIPHKKLVTSLVCDCNHDEGRAKKVLGGKEFDVVIDCISYCPKEVYNVLSNVKTSRYIQVSSIGVYQDSVTDEDRRLHSPVKEDRFDPRTYQEWKMETSPEAGYGIRKRYAECAAYQMFPHCNPISIRSAYAADPSNPAHEQNARIPELVSWIREGKRIDPSNKNYAVCFTRVDEEADLILELISNGYQEPLNISSSGYIKIGDMIAYIAGKLGVEPHYGDKGEFVHFPSGIHLDTKRLSETGFGLSRLSGWFWNYLDFYIEYPAQRYKPWREVRGAIDTFQRGACAVKNHSFDIYKKMSLLLSEGVHLADILQGMGIKSIYVYGAGEMGKMALADLSGRMDIPAVFDRSVKSETSISICKKVNNHMEKETVFEYPFRHPDSIPEDETIILITPAAAYQEIVKSMINRGISRRRFLSLNLLLYYGMYGRTESKNRRQKKVSGRRYVPRKEFLITGAQFRNKGSQSMLFTAASEIRKRFEDAVIWFCPNFGDEEYEKAADKYRMIFLLDGTDEESTLYEALPRLDGIIDVSGYGLTSQKWVNATDRELGYFKMAREYQIPVYLMPQSFGPFEYEKDKIEEIKELLSYIRVIYAREKAGYRLLADTFSLTNVKQSVDLVLQNTGIQLEDVYFNVDQNKRYDLPTHNNAAIIPNIQNDRNGLSQDLLAVYKEIIGKLLAFGKDIYIISHSEDEAVCEAIYEPYQYTDAVHWYKQEFDCVGFGELAGQFQYIIGSRYHAVVHAYKKHVPCIVIGWAEKYRELLELFGQTQYLFDVRKRIHAGDVRSALDTMEKSYGKEAEKIAAILPGIQARNCFDIFDNQ